MKDTQHIDSRLRLLRVVLTPCREIAEIRRGFYDNDNSGTSIREWTQQPPHWKWYWRYVYET